MHFRHHLHHPSCYHGRGYQLPHRFQTKRSHRSPSNSSVNSTYFQFYSVINHNRTALYLYNNIIQIFKSPIRFSLREFEEVYVASTSASDLFCPPRLNVDRHRQAYLFYGRASPFTSVYVGFETVAGFTQRTPPSLDLQFPCSTDVVRLGIKPHG
ncbi:hypothetical protein HA466_0000680 [Hirschfeldia incana]|nr:hypothetical protein HA466_0000680 [Hirschfeldia incana]